MTQERITAAEFRRRYVAQLQADTNPSRRKYGNIPTEVDGYRFDSQKEAERYGILKLRQQNGEIHGLQVHPRFELVPACEINGRRFRAAYYEADFSYFEDGHDGMVIEDVKGSKATLTQVYRLKQKIMAYRGYEVREVY